MRLDDWENLKRIGGDMQTQDNRATADPMFYVKDVTRIYGEHLQQPHGYVYIVNDDEYIEIEGTREGLLEHLEDVEASPEFINKCKKLDEVTLFNVLRNGRISSLCRVEYREYLYVITVCFTEVAASAYIARHLHDLNRPFTYAGSMYNNPEMRAVRQMLIDMGEKMF